MERKRIGIIVNTFGLKGLLKVYMTTSYKDDRFKKGNKVFIKYEDKYECHTITYVHFKNEHIVEIQLSDLNDINEVTKYINSDLMMDVELKEGQVFYDSFINKDLCDEKLNVIGKVKTIVESDVVTYIVSETNKYIPYQMNIFVKEIDLENNRIILTSLGKEALIDEN